MNGFVSQFRSWHLLALVVLLSGCAGKSLIRIHRLPSFSSEQPERILFLDFAIDRRGPGAPERFRLVNAVVSGGRCRDCGQSTFAGGYRLQCRYVYRDNRPSLSETVEHPLLRTVEVHDSSGSISRQPVTLNEGHLSIRVQYDSTLSAIELLSITPDRGTNKRHTLRIHP